MADTKWTGKDTKELRDFGIQIITIGHLDANQAKRLSELIGNTCERIKQLEAVLVNEKSITAKAYTACGNYQQRIKELEDSDAWRKSATEFYENGGCLICFETDEAGCKEGCYLGQQQLKVERYENALCEIIKESGNIDRNKWPAQQQKCQIIADKALKG